ncbi:unnamed protein product [Rotaria sp. Silwood1]|nr:unnamed protein product [Rotaria sp. Silwood1]CAF1658744.1 unnamed protein product [Rotaria sp. Silwood1]
MAAGGNITNDKELLKLQIQFFKEQRLTEEAKLKVEKEITKRQDKDWGIQQMILKQKNTDVIIEEKKRQQLVLENELELSKAKRMKTTHEKHPISSSDILAVLKDHNTFYNLYVKKQHHGFDINKVLNNNNNNNNYYLNEKTIGFIRNYFNSVLLLKEINEDKIQVLFQGLILNLLNELSDYTVLKYVDTHSISSINATFRPDCCFLYKNVNINCVGGRKCLQDFIICVGEYKKSNRSMTDSVGQIFHYLHLLLDKQNRKKIYGFLINNKQMIFLYVEKGDKPDLYDYYESENLDMFINIPKRLSSVAMSITNKQWRKKYLNEVTWKIFTNFLTMNENFFEYRMLNIDHRDDLLGNKYEIMQKLGSGLTSMVYLLRNNENNSLNDDTELHVLKISKCHGFEENFINEVKITNELKQLNDLDKFNSFFQDILHDSPTGRFLIFNNVLEHIQSLKSDHLSQLVDIIQCLYDSHIIHRDIRPQNLMIDCDRKHLKLIDFGFAIKYETIKKLSIAGTITYASDDLLNCYLKSLLNGKYSTDYHYERMFDLKCTLNLIMSMINERVSVQLNAIEELPPTIDKVMDKLNYDIRY